MKRKFIIVAIVGLGLLAASPLVWSEIFPSGTWHYKMTVTVETPEGFKTGSVVREVSNSASKLKIIDLPESGNPAKFRGEAAVIDLGNKGKVFALLSDTPYSEFYRAFPIAGASTPQGIQYYNGLKVGLIARLAEGDYPQMVVFSNLNDPKSVKDVSRQIIIGSFASGVKLKSVEFKITKEPVTWEISNTLLWLDGLKGGYLHGGHTSRDAPLGLHAGNFKAKGAY